MSKVMTAAVAGDGGLAISDVPIPAPGPGQILVKVSVAGVNRADLNAAKGAGVASRDALGKPIGMEWAGEVVALGEGVASFRLGDRVACSGTGGYAQFAVADAGRALPVPAALSLAEAAVLPLSLMTAYNALVMEGRFVAGQSVLVHGATSAAGIAAIRIARILGAGMIAGTSTTADKRDGLKAQGADVAIDPTSDGWFDDVLAATDGRGADVVVDMVTGPGLNDTMRATAVHGHLVNVGRLGGLRCDLDLDLHALRRINLVGVTFRSRSVDEVRAIVAAVRADLWPHVAAGTLRLPIDRRFALADALEAHRYMAANGHFGKIALVV